MRFKLLATFLIFANAHAVAQDLEEIVVTGMLSGSSVPGKHLRQPADNLLLRVQITNDSRDEEQREDEIHRTLLAAISAADRNDLIELSTVTDSGFVVPLTRANYQIELARGQRPDTSQAYFRAKSAVPDSLDDGEALVLELKSFVDDLRMTGRTEVFVEGDVEVSIVNPNQYRDEAIKLFAEDVKAVTDSLGGDYRVVVNGIDRPIQWRRAGSLSVAIYIPYDYLVVPTTLSGVTFSDY